MKNDNFSVPMRWKKESYLSILVRYLREANVFFVVDGEGGDFVSVNFD